MYDIPMIAGVFLSLGVFLVSVLRYEVGLPVKLGLLVVPPIVLTGGAISYLLHYRFAISMLQSLAVLSAALLVVIGIYEFVKAGKSVHARRRRV